MDYNYLICLLKSLWNAWYKTAKFVVTQNYDNKTFV